MTDKQTRNTDLAEITLPEERTDVPAAGGASLVSDPIAARTPQRQTPQPNIPTVRHTPTRAIFSAAPPAPTSAPERDYRYSALLSRVTVLPWPQRYNYYQRFTEDARRFAGMRGKPCAPVPFFSYIPQYAQLGRDQLLFYFWFREQSRAREEIDGVDFPYILLYIYELINLPDDPAAGAETIAWLWLTYRRRFAELDKYLAEWMCDYCLVHALPCPASLAPLTPEIVRRASLKEFYLSPMQGGANGDLHTLSDDALILLCSDYHYRTSKYYNDHAEEYDREIPAAVGAAARQCGLFPTPEKLRVARAERDAFCGSLCAQTVKRRIRVVYLSLSRSHEMREAVTQAVKLAENQLRRRLKISSRLKITPPSGEPVAAVAAAVSAAISGYFQAGEPPRTKAEKLHAEERAWQKLYDAPTSGMDADYARSLENLSWENTALLTGDEPAAPEAPEAAPPTKTAAIESKAIESPLAAYLAAIFAGESSAAWCTAHGLRKTDAARLSAEINDYAADALGDVILEEGAAGWQLIEDYREDVAKWIKTYQK